VRRKLVNSKVGQVRILTSLANFLFQYAAFALLEKIQAKEQTNGLHNCWQVTIPIFVILHQSLIADSSYEKIVTPPGCIACFVLHMFLSLYSLQDQYYQFRGNARFGK
jgi:hypothetical protein